MINIAFEPDENATVNERAAPILIVDDEINEASRQAFVVQLRLVESINQSAVDLTTRPASLCRIIDNDSNISDFSCYQAFISSFLLLQ